MLTSHGIHRRRPLYENPRLSSRARTMDRDAALRWPLEGIRPRPVVDQTSVAPDVFVPTWRPGPAPSTSWARQRGIWMRERSHTALTLVALVYLLAVSFSLVLNGGWPTPDLLIPPLLLLAVAYKRGWAFVIDWAPLLFLVLAYESFRGLADDLNSRVAFQSLIDADRLLLGGVTGPEFLQSRLFDPTRVAWYDWAASLMYSAHYIWPVALGFALWLRSRTLFWRFSLSMVTLFFMGFLTYYLYPAAPPWMASDVGLIAPINRVMITTLSTLGATQPFAVAYQEFSPNPVAALPSLHSALPMLLTMIVISVVGRKALPLLVYPVIGGFMWVYLGEHYLIDVFAGWLYAVAAFVLVWVVVFPRAVEAWREHGRSHVPSRVYRSGPAPSWPLALGALVLIGYVWLGPALHLELPL